MFNVLLILRVAAFGNLGSGTASGAGTGNAGPGGVSASGVAISSAQVTFSYRYSISTLTYCNIFFFCRMVDLEQPLELELLSKISSVSIYY